MEKIAITGSNGFFALRFIDFYKDKYDITPLSRNELDIKSYEKAIEVIKSIKPTYLIHTAAISDTTFCEKNPELSYDVNVNGSINIAKACRMMGIKMIYLSSDQVYGGNENIGPYDEITLPITNNIYGKHKLEAEEAIKEILEDGVILRITWLYSLPERNKPLKPNIIWNVVKAALNNKPVEFRTNEYRGITYVYDLINAFDKILQLPGGVYNAGSENNLNTYELGEIILKEMGLEHRIHELLIKDTESFKNKNRDLRICNKKLEKYDIYFDETEKSLSKCINDFKFHIF
ncbi:MULTISPECIES: SDR family oxidoreductase [unclassified Clostridium]|uniref:SDR family oxidoreductase n=1 Tax=unclassified Clostridium TaxID=2614128 RepID=UPI000ECE1BED|nr:MULTISPECIES: sugar nucleotide-binding protein [unclassified Clostridium]HCQ90295.1 NAD(P)-dependent oxidoreductase [Clostridium sp.]